VAEEGELAVVVVLVAEHVKEDETDRGVLPPGDVYGAVEVGLVLDELADHLAGFVEVGEEVVAVGRVAVGVESGAPLAAVNVVGVSPVGAAGV
jgi:hypothetical protein